MHICSHLKLADHTRFPGNLLNMPVSNLRQQVAHTEPSRVVRPHLSVVVAHMYVSRKYNITCSIFDLPERA